MENRIGKLVNNTSSWVNKFEAKPKINEEEKIELRLLNLSTVGISKALLIYIIPKKKSILNPFST
jgi:hypothetical protein